MTDVVGEVVKGACEVVKGACEVVKEAGEVVEGACEVVEEALRPLGIPLVLDLPFGHGERNVPWPLGVRAGIDGDAGTLAWAGATAP